MRVEGQHVMPDGDGVPTRMETGGMPDGDCDEIAEVDAGCEDTRYQINCDGNRRTSREHGGIFILGLTATAPRVHGAVSGGPLICASRRGHQRAIAARKSQPHRVKVRQFGLLFYCECTNKF